MSYAIRQENYNKVLAEINNTECFTRYTGEGTKSIFYSSDVFQLKGTRFFLTIDDGSPFFKGDQNKPIVKWYLKKKYKKFFMRIKFLEVLDRGHLIKTSRRAELLFHLDILS
jgi:hypothetical protein